MILQIRRQSKNLGCQKIIVTDNQNWIEERKQIGHNRDKLLPFKILAQNHTFVH